MTLIKDYVRAGYVALCVPTHEPERAVKSLISDLRTGRNVAVWDIVKGLRTNVCSSQSSGGKLMEADEALVWLSESVEGTVLFIKNAHKVWDSMMFVQTLQNLWFDLKKFGRTIVMVTIPSPAIPKEIERMVTLHDFELPKAEDLVRSVEVVTNSVERDMPLKAELELLVEHGLGLTVGEFENALALSFVQKGTLDRKTLIEQKAQMLRKAAGVEFGRFSTTFTDIGGLENLKQFTKATVGNPYAKGIIEVGVPGTGKTLTAKALGNETRRPTIIWDPGSAQSKYVGESGGQMREAIKAIRAQGPVIVMIDEIEKAFAGARGSGDLDSGVKQEMTGIMLQFLDDPGDAYIICTCNNLQILPPEFQRSGRWDSVFFVDLPTLSERSIIWDIHCANYDLNRVQTLPDDVGWTGADIQTCCRIAAMMSIPLVEASRYVVPISQSMEKDIKSLRDWAGRHAVPASDEGIKNGNGDDKLRRIEQ